MSSVTCLWIICGVHQVIGFKVSITKVLVFQSRILGISLDVERNGSSPSFVLSRTPYDRLRYRYTLSPTNARVGLKDSQCLPRESDWLHWKVNYLILRLIAFFLHSFFPLLC